MEKPLFKGKLLALYKRRVTLPNGYKVELEVIKHPGAALVVPLLTAGKIILLRQFRAVINSYIYELPAGTLDRGESPLLCARREIVEETGYSAEKFVRLGHVFPVPGYSTEKITIFKATGLKKSIRQPEEDEIIKHAVFSRRQIKGLFKRGKIVDAKTISALAMIGWL